MTIEEHRNRLNVKRRLAIQFLLQHWKWKQQWIAMVKHGTLEKGGF